MGYLDPIPAGTECVKGCGRDATTRFGDALSLTHGGGEFRCEICVLEEQLTFAKERAAAVPDLERRLTDLRATA